MTPSVKLRGDCYAMTCATEHESVLSGPRDTGKTVACCYKLHMFATYVPGCQLGIVRKSQASMSGTVLQTFNRTITGQGVRMYGKTNPYRYDYPNGSVVWVGGMDNAGKVLSSERDAIYVNQAEELEEGDWETLGACCSGRGARVQHPQLFGDCNPGARNHWIKRRAKEGKLRLMVARHQDNPELFDEAGNLTEGGKKRLAVLAHSYTGVRRARMFLGEWTSAEGAVYRFSRVGVVELYDVGGKKVEVQVGPHVLTRPPQEMKRWLLCGDEGYTNPAVVLLVGVDGDDRWHVFREFHRSGVLQKLVVSQAQAWFLEKKCEMMAVDESAAGLIADLIDAGVNAKPGKGRVLDGIQRLQNRLATAGDGKPRLTFDPACEETINEFESYVWKPGKDEPVKEHDHGPDALRYLADVLGEPTGAITDPKLISVGGQDPRIGPGPRVFVPRHFEPRRLG